MNRQVLKNFLYFCLVIVLGFNLGKLSNSYDRERLDFYLGYVRALSDIKNGGATIVDSENVVIYPSSDSIIGIPVKILKEKR